LTALRISNVVLWILQIGTIIVLLGVARQVGLLHLRLPAKGAGSVDDGPPIGAKVDLPPVISAQHKTIPILVRDRLSLVTFASPGCSVCVPVMQAVRSLKSTERGVWFLVAVDGDEGQVQEYSEKYGLRDNCIAAASLGTIDRSHRPFSVVLSSAGVVLAAGVPNTLEQLEVLLGAARRENSAHSGEISPDGSSTGNGSSTGPHVLSPGAS
jgi:methylamine dehydrogenase accessory protein MauD